VRRRLAYLLVWTLATTATVSASWLGVRSVLATAAPSRTQPLSAAELRDAAPAKPSPTPSPTPAASPSPPRPRAPTPTPTGQWTAAPDGRGGTAYRRTFRLRGGEVTVWCARGDVRLLGAKPAQGYEVDRDLMNPENLLVTLRSRQHTSRVFVSWRDGPYAELTESV
jgi:hypothetical protein